MTDDLGQGGDAREGFESETSNSNPDSNSSANMVSGAESVSELVGQAAISVAQPAAGETVPIPAEAGQRYVIEFDPETAAFQIDGNDLILVFPGDGRVVFENLGEAAYQPDAPVFVIAGQPISSAAIFGQALALAEGTLETAAGAGVLPGTGATRYDDDTGEIIDLLDPLGVIPPVERAFPLIDLFPRIVDLDAGALAANNPPVDFDIAVTAEFADVLPFTFAPDLIPTETKTFAFSISDDNPNSDNPDTNTPELFKVNLDTGEAINLGPLVDFDGRTLFGDFEGLTFGQGADAGFLFAYDDSGQSSETLARIVKIDPDTARVVQIFELTGETAFTGGNPGLTVNSQGRFFAIFDNDAFDPIATNGTSLAGLYEITLNEAAGTFTLSFLGNPPDLGEATGLVADPNDPTVLFALGDDGVSTVKLIKITLGPTPTIEVLPGTISFGDPTNSDFQPEYGLSFAPDGTLWGLAEDETGDRPAYAFQIDPATGNSIAGTLIVLPAFQGGFESIAVAQETMDGAIFPGADMPMPFLFLANRGSSNDGESGIADNILKVSLDGKIVEVAVSEGEIQQAIGAPVDLEESGVQVDAAGNIFFTTDEAGEDTGQQQFVLVKLAATGEVKIVAQGSNQSGDLLRNFDPEGLALAADGTLYVLDDNEPRIIKIATPLGTPSISELAVKDDIEAAIRAKLTAEQIEVRTFFDLEIDQGIAVSADGQTLYLPVFDINVSTPTSNLFGLDAVISVNAASGAVTVLTSLTGNNPFSQLDEFIAVAPGGDVLVVDDDQDTVYRVDPADGSVSVFLSREDLETANDGNFVDLDGGFRFDPDGNFYIANQGSNNILMFPALDPVAGTVIVQAGQVIASQAELNAQIGNTGIDLSGDLDIGLMAMTVPTGSPSEFVAPAAAFILDNKDSFPHSDSEQILRVGVDGSVSVAVTHAEIVEAARNGVFDSIDISFNNRGIAADPAGNIYFSESTSNSIYVKPADGGPLRLLASEVAIEQATREATGSSGDDPRDITFAADGFLYVAEEDSDSILKVDPITGDVRVLTTKAQFLDLVTALEGHPDLVSSDPRVDLDGGILANAAGTTLYVTSDGEPEVVFEIDLATGTPSILSADPRFSDLDVYMTLAPNGDIILADDSSGGQPGENGDTIFRITPAGVVTEFLTEAQLEAVVGQDVDLEGGIWFDSDGNFYIAEEDTDTIYRWTAADPAAGTINTASGAVFLSSDAIEAAVGSDPDFDGGAVFVPESPTGFGAGFFQEFAVGSTGITNIRGTDVEDGITTQFTITTLPTDASGAQIGFLLIDRGGDGVVDQILGPGFDGVPFDVQTGDSVIWFLPKTSFKVKPDAVTFEYFTTDSDGLTSLLTDENGQLTSVDDPGVITITLPDVQPSITVQSRSVDEDDIQGRRIANGLENGQSITLNGVLGLGQEPGSDTLDLGDPPFDPDGQQPDTAIGRIRVDFGFDGPGSVRLTEANIANLEALGLTSSTNDAPLSYVLSDDGRTLVATAGEDGILPNNGAGSIGNLEEVIFLQSQETVFVLRIAPGTSDSDFTYTLELRGSINHPLTDDPATPEVEAKFEDSIVLPLELQATDADGDTATASFEVSIVDDVPTIGFDGGEGSTGFSIDGDFNPELWQVNLDPDNNFSFPIWGFDGGEGSDFEGLTFGTNGKFLFAYDDDNEGAGQRILKIDPDNGTTLGVWNLERDEGDRIVFDPGLTVNAAGQFFAIGDGDSRGDEDPGSLFKVIFEGKADRETDGTFRLELVATQPATLGLELTGLAADPNDASILYALGRETEVAGVPYEGTVKLVKITLVEDAIAPSGFTVAPDGFEVLPGTIALMSATDSQHGLSFAPDGILWGLIENEVYTVEEQGVRTVAFQIDPETGASIAGTTVELPNGQNGFESLAVTQENPGDLKVWEQNLDWGASTGDDVTATVVFGADGPEVDPVLSDDPSMVTADEAVIADIKLDIVKIEELDESGNNLEGGNETVSSLTGGVFSSGLFSRVDPTDPDSPALEVFLERPLIVGGPLNGQVDPTKVDPTKIVGFVEEKFALVVDEQSGNIIRIGLNGGGIEIAVTVEEIAAAIGTDPSNVDLDESGVKIDAAGNIFFTTDEGDDLIDQFVLVKLAATGDVRIIASTTSVTGSPQSDFDGSGFDPEDLVLGPNGTLYILDDGLTERVVKIENPLSGTPVVSDLITAADIETALAEVSDIRFDTGIAISQDGQTIYVPTEGTPQGIVAIDIATGTPSLLTPVDNPFEDNDNFIAVAPNGDIIVADDAAMETIYRVNKGTGAIEEFISNAVLESFGGSVDLDGGIAFDKDGNFYIADEANENILKFPALDPVAGTIDTGAGVILAGEQEILDATGLSNIDFDGGLTTGVEKVPVFEATVDLDRQDNGEYRAPIEFVLFRPLVHPDDDNPDTTEVNESEFGEGRSLVGPDPDSIKFSFTVTVRDDDGDANSIPVTVTVDDDGPRVFGNTTAIVDEDDLPAPVRIDFDDVGTGALAVDAFPEATFSSSTGQILVISGAENNGGSAPNFIFAGTGSTLSVSFAEPVDDLNFTVAAAQSPEGVTVAQVDVFDMGGSLLGTVDVDGNGANELPNRVDLSRFHDVGRIEVRDIGTDIGGVGYDDFTFTVPRGNPGGPGDDAVPDVDGDNNETTFTGLINAGFGADGPGDIDFAALDGQPVMRLDDNGDTLPLTSRGDALVYKWDADTHTLSAVVEGAPTQAVPFIHVIDDQINSILKIGLDGSDITVLVSKADIEAALFAATGQTASPNLDEKGVAVDGDGNVFFTVNGGFQFAAGGDAHFVMVKPADGGPPKVVASTESFLTATGQTASSLDDPFDVEGLALRTEPDGKVTLFVLNDAESPFEESIVEITDALGTPAISVLLTESQMEALTDISNAALDTGIAISPLGDILYVNTEGTPDGLIKIDLAALDTSVSPPNGVSLLAPVDPNNNPFSQPDLFIAIAPDGDIIVADKALQKLLRVDKDGGAVSDFLTTQQIAQVAELPSTDVDLDGGFGFDAAGNFYLAHDGNPANEDILFWPVDNLAAGTIQTDPGAASILVSKSAILGVTGDTGVDFHGGLTIGDMIMPGEGDGFLVTWTQRNANFEDAEIFGQILDLNGMPVGPEFTVNSTQAGDQLISDAATLAGGRIAVTWQGAGPGDDDGIFAQVFSPTGQPLGGQIPVNTTVADVQFDANVTALSGGGFVVTWQDGSNIAVRDVVARIFDADGNPASAEIPVSAPGVGGTSEVEVTALANGGFVVTWRDSSTADTDSLARVFGADGSAVTDPFPVSVTTDNLETQPDVTALSGGGFVIAWQSFASPSGDTDVLARVFGADGMPQGGDIALATVPDFDQTGAHVAALPDGGFAVSWRDDADGDNDIVVRFFNASGVPQTGVIPVNTSAGGQFFSEIEALANGNVLVTWRGNGVGDDDGLFARIFQPDGTALSGEFRINEIAAGSLIETNLDIVPLADGGFAASWEGSTGGIVGRVFGASGNALTSDFPVNTTTEGFVFGPAGAAPIEFATEAERTIFEVRITDVANAEFKVSLLDQLDHPVASTEDNLVLDLEYRITDFDGDTQFGILRVDIDDDSPVVDDVLVTHDETPGVDDDGDEDDVDPATKSASLVGALRAVFGLGETGDLPPELGVAVNDFEFAFGADGPGGIALDAVAPDTPSGLFDTRTGRPILLFTEEVTLPDGPTRAIVGRVALETMGTGPYNGMEGMPGEIAFVAFLEESGTQGGLGDPLTADMWFVQYRAIVHDNPADPDEAGPEGGDFNDEFLTLTYTVTDFDGDTVQGTATITIEDDGPTIIQENLMTLVHDETAGVQGLGSTDNTEGATDDDDDDVAAALLTDQIADAEAAVEALLMAGTVDLTAIGGVQKTLTDGVDFDAGADGLKAVTFDVGDDVSPFSIETDDPTGLFATADGEEVQYVVVSDTLILGVTELALLPDGMVDDFGRVVISLHLEGTNNTGFTFVQYEAVVHPLPGDGTGTPPTHDEGLAAGQVDNRLKIGYIVEDGDGDKTASGDGIITVDIEDDGPRIDGENGGILLVHDESAGLQTLADGDQSTPTEDDNDDDLSVPAVQPQVDEVEAELAAVPNLPNLSLTAIGGVRDTLDEGAQFDAGADGLKEVRFDTSAIQTSNPTGLTASADGELIEFFVVNDELILGVVGFGSDINGRDTFDRVAFSLHLETTDTTLGMGKAEFTFVQYEAVVHPLPGDGSGTPSTHDEGLADGGIDARLKIGFVVEDNDGDTAIATGDAGIVVDIEDDGPAFIVQEGREIFVQEQDIATGGTGPVIVTVDFGADGPDAATPLRIDFAGAEELDEPSDNGVLVTTATSSGLTSGGAPVLVQNLDELTVVGFVDNLSEGTSGAFDAGIDTEVFRAELDPDTVTARIEFSLDQPLDHPDVGEAGADDRIRLLFDVTVKDGDQDTAVERIGVTVDDDEPLVERVTLTHDETPGVNNPDDIPPMGPMGKSAALNAALEKIFDPDPAIDPEAVPEELGVARKEFDFDYGADGPGGIALDSVADDTDSGLDDTATGRDIFLFNGPDGTIVGRVGIDLNEADPDGAIAFAIFLEETGGLTLPDLPDNESTAEVSFVQYRAIVHDNPEDPDEANPEPIGFADEFVDVTYSVTDSEGDSKTETIRITIEDDGPTILGDGAGVSVQEAEIEDSAPITLDVRFGADGPNQAMAALTLGFVPPAIDVAETIGETPMDLAGLTTPDGDPITVGNLDDLTVVGFVDNGSEGTQGTFDEGIDTEVFRATFDALAGQFTFDLKGPLEHPDLDQSGRDDRIQLKFDLTAKDGDGDTATQRLTVDVEDDQPSATAQTMIADETAGLDADSDDVALNTIPVAIRDEATGLTPINAAAKTFAFDYGADGPGGIALEPIDETAFPDGQPSTLFDTETFDPIFLFNGAAVDAVTVVGRVGGEQGPIAFVAFLEETGAPNGLPNNTYEATSWFVQYRAIRHDNPFDPDEAGPEGTPLFDDETLALSYTVTDGDGDTVTRDLTVEIQDDGPTADPAERVEVNEDDLPARDFRPAGNDDEAPRESLTAIGGLGIDFGADGPLLRDPTFEVELLTLVESRGQPVDFFVGFLQSGEVGTGFASGRPIFEISFDAAADQYTFTLLDSLDHPVPGRGTPAPAVEDTLTLEFRVTASDGDFDRVDTTVRVDVVDDVPIAVPVDPVEVNEDDLTPPTFLGNDDGPGRESLSATGDMGIRFGADGDIDLVSGARLLTPVFSQDKEVTLESPDQNRFVGRSADGRDVFELVFRPDLGEYTFRLEDNLDHAAPPPGTAVENTLTLRFEFDTQDFDGDRITSEIAVEVVDDIPVADPADTARVDEDGLRIADDASFDGNGGGRLSDTRDLGIAFGADGPLIEPTVGPIAIRDVTLNTAVSSQNEAVTLVQVGDRDYEGQVADGRKVFELGFDSFGRDYTFTLLDNLDHPAPGPGEEPAVQDTLTLDFGFTATDGDRDTVASSLSVDVVDDIPIANPAETLTFDEDDLEARPGGTSTFDGNDVPPPEPLSDTGKLGIAFGADGPRDIISVLILDPRELFSQGEQVFLDRVGTSDTYMGRADGRDVFELSFDKDNSEYTFTLLDNLDHDPGAGDTPLTLTFNFAAFDGDEDQASSTLSVRVVDDVPIAVPVDPVRVDEDDLRIAGTSTFDGNGGAPVELMATGNLGIAFGADGPGNIIDVELLTTVSSQDVSVVLSLLGTGVPGDPIAGAIGFAGSRPVFNLDFDVAAGTYKFTLLDNLDHPAGGDETPLPLTFRFTAEDGDFDPITSSFTVNVVDDVPIADLVAMPEAMLVLDETVGPRVGDPNAADELASADPNDIGFATITGAELFTDDSAFGADGPGTPDKVFSLTLTAGPTGLTDTASNEAVVLSGGGVAIEGRTAIGNALVFRISVDPDNGNVTVAQFRALKHDDPLDPDESTPPNTNPEIMNAGLVALTVTVTDGDFDTDTDADGIELGALIKFEDDGPIALDDMDTVQESALPVIGSGMPPGGMTIAMGNLLTNDTEGADGASITSVESAMPDVNGVITVMTAKGTLQVFTRAFAGKAAGDYEYTLENPTTDPATDAFGYVLTDGDGDTDDATLTITIEDDVPTAKDDMDMVVEGEFAVNTLGNVITGIDTDGPPNDGDLEKDIEGADGIELIRAIEHNNVIYTLNAAGDDIDTTDATTGLPVIASFNLTTSGILTIPTELGGTLSIRLTGQFKGLYSYEPPASLTHTDGEPIPETFDYTVEDADGSPSTATLTIEVKDTAPEARDDTGTVQESALPGGTALPSNGTTMAEGNLLTNDIVRADGATITSVAGEVAVAGVITATSAAGTLTVYTTDAAAIAAGFTKAGDYKYTLQFPTTDGPGPETDAFGYVLTDGDGSQDTATLTIEIVDDVPIGRDDFDVVNAGAATDGNVITGVDANDPDGSPDLGEADTPGADGVGAIRSIEHDGITYTLNAAGDDFTFAGASTSGNTDPAAATFDPLTAELTIQTALGGTLKIDLLGADVGEYIYTAPASLATTQLEVFNYALEDGDGDIDPVLTITVNPGEEDGKPSVLDVDAIHDETAGVNLPSDDTGDQPPSQITDLATGLTLVNVSKKAIPFSFGSDGPGGIALDDVTDGDFAQVGGGRILMDTGTGRTIRLFNGANDTVIGRVSAADGSSNPLGAIAFIAFIEQTGTPTGPANEPAADLWLAQYRPILHDNPLDPDEAVELPGEVTESITFDTLATGAYDGTDGAVDGRFAVFGDGGSGPILVSGLNPAIGPGTNAAVVFDTANPGGLAAGFGTPHQDFGGPGTGSGGAAGSAFVNNVPLGKVLIMGREGTLVDGDGDGLIDTPLPQGFEMITTTFDFSEIDPRNGVTLKSITLLDVDVLNGNPGTVVLFGADPLNPLATFLVSDAGFNGVETIEFGRDGVSGVLRMVVTIDGSAGFDNIVFTRAIDPLDEVFELKYTVTDGGPMVDTASGTGTITIEDDGPTALAEPVVFVDEGSGAIGTGTGAANILDNDDFGADGAGAVGPVTTFSYTGDDGTGTMTSTTLEIPAGVTVPETFIGGELTVNADGSWVYEPPANVTEATSEVFSYTILDGDGDTSTVGNEIVVLDTDLAGAAGEVRNGIAGPEFFSFGPGDLAPTLAAADVISGFEDGTDLIELTGGLNVSDIQVGSNSAGHAVIATTGNLILVTLENIDPADINNDDFITGVV